MVDIHFVSIKKKWFKQLLIELFVIEQNQGKSTAEIKNILSTIQLFFNLKIITSKNIIMKEGKIIGINGIPRVDNEALLRDILISSPSFGKVVTIKKNKKDDTDEEDDDDINKEDVDEIDEDDGNGGCCVKKVSIDTLVPLYVKMLTTTSNKYGIL
jgi:hypothetical protein